MINETFDFYDIYCNYKEFSSEIESDFNRQYFMPSLKDNYNIYAVTHEYGHLIHNFLMNNELGNSKTKREYDLWLRRAEDRIYTIAFEDNVKLSIKDLLHMASEYSRLSSAEFFAECFANSQLGRNNALGNAIIKFLKEKGIE